LIVIQTKPSSPGRAVQRDPGDPIFFSGQMGHPDRSQKSERPGDDGGGSRTLARVIAVPLLIVI
jgi:hypothetical protein